MEYIHTESGEVWSGQPSTRNISNFYLLSHEEKVSLGWAPVPKTPKTLDQLKAEKLAVVKVLASNNIYASYPLFKQINAALGLYSQSVVDALKSKVESVKAQVDAYEQQILEATQEEDLDFEVTWQ